MRRRTALAMLTFGTILVPLATGCQSADTQTTRNADQTITVLAAASLTDTFTEIAERFESEHPGTKVTLSFGGSSTLATQIRHGAPADVFASAATGPMAKLGGDKLVQTPKNFARNSMTIAVPATNPAGITTVADLARAKVALCQAEVPCGVAGATYLKAAGVSVTPVTEEADVKGVLTKVTMGEVDAGLVYTTDVKAAGDKVLAIAVPAGVEATNDYPIAVVRASKNQALAQAFVDAVTAAAGQQTLQQAGFLPAR